MDEIGFLESRTSEVTTSRTEGRRSLSVSTGSFDTAIASCRTNALRNTAVGARDVLRENGTLLLAIDGWPRHAISNDRSFTRTLNLVRRRNARRIRRTLREAGFDSVRLYGVFPSISDPSFVYPLSDGKAVRWFIDNKLSAYRRPLARAAHATGAFEQIQPGYVAVCDVGPRSFTPDSAVTSVSYNRTLTFELESGDLARVRKAPRLGTHDATTRNEQSVLDHLIRSGENVPDEVTHTLPSGSLTTSPTGATRIELPASGVPIAEQIEPDPSAVRTSLDTAFEWLASFQEAYRGEEVVYTPDDLRSRAAFPEVGITGMPAIDSPVTSFVAPCHGDFHPWNVYASDGDVTTVIDWEYATRRGDPAVDPAHFLLYVCSIVGDDFGEGFELLCASDTPYSTAVGKSLDRYCERVGLSRRAIVAALSYAHVHTLRTLSELRDPSVCADLYRTYESRFGIVTAEFESAIETLG